jgi:signal transduction histidine kinase
MFLLPLMRTKLSAERDSVSSGGVALPPRAFGPKHQERGASWWGALMVAIVAVIFVVDYFMPANLIVSFFYLLALPPALFVRSRRCLWGIIGASALLTIVGALSPAPADFDWIMWANRTMSILVMLCLSAALDRYLRSEGGRLRAEAELRRLNEGLELRVREEVAKREAAQANVAHLQRIEALGQLAGGIAHDFNNVLQAVQVSASMIERGAAETENVRGLARTLLKAAARGSAITGRLLAFSRRGDLRSEEVDPVSLLTDMHEILTHTLGTTIRLRVAACAGLPPLSADKGQLETVLVNLATNARDAMANHGVLTLAAALETSGYEDGHDHSPPLRPGRYVCLSVTDTGAGMAPEVLARVTEPFFTTKPHGKGTGLGLALARGLAEQSGGGLCIESALGHGTTVKMWFPVAEGASAAEADDAKAVAIGQKQHARLLVVDDEDVVREVLAQGLEARGYIVLSAADGPAALAFLDAGEIVDLVVSDVCMPGMDGVTLVREMQRRRKGLPAILLTGFAASAVEIGSDSANSGVFSLLRKPIEEKVLVKRVELLLGRVAA